MQAALSDALELDRLLPRRPIGLGYRAGESTRQGIVVFLRSFVVEVAAGEASAVVDRIRDDVVAAMSEQPGFFAYYVLDLGADQVASVRVFEDQTSLDAATEVLRPLVNPIAEQYFLATVSEYAGDVSTGLAYARLWL